MGFTVTIGFSCLFLIDTLSEWNNKFIQYFFIFYFSLILLSFANLSFTYGNVLHHNNLYEERIGTLIMNDIETASNQYNISLNRPKVAFVNAEKVESIRRNNLTSKSIEKYPILKSLVYPYFTGDNFGIIKFETFGLQTERIRIEELEFLAENEWNYAPNQKPIISRQLYNLYLEKDDIFVVYFKG